jgi:hypothetical protein
VYRDRQVNDNTRFGWHYRRVDRHGAGEAITPQTLHGARIAVADLLP